MDEYIDIQYLLKNFHAFDHAEKAYECFNQKLIERECRRLWGNTVFDDSEVTDEDRKKSEKIKKEILDAAEKGKMNLKPKD